MYLVILFLFFIAGFVMGAMYSVYKLKSYDHHYQVLQQQQSDSFNGSNQTPILPKRFCKICLTNIIGKDHHCVWLDVCISEDNFPYFLSFLACIFHESGFVRAHISHIDFA